MKRAKNRRSALVVYNDDTIAARGNESVIDSRHGILVTIGCSDRERNERHAVQSFTDLVNHDDDVLYQKLAALHDLFAVEPDVEITADAVDMRLGNPVCAGVLGVGMAKSDVDTRDFFVL